MNVDSKRNSGIDLLKVIGILLVIMGHVIQTLTNTERYVTYSDYMLDFSVSTTNVQYLILKMLGNSGHVGNFIFFICSSWFLADSEYSDNKKMFQMLLDIWMVSVVILTINYILKILGLGGCDVQAKHIIKSLLPTMTSSNWYMTCYLLFYPLHPLLNKIIKGMSKRILLRCTIVLLFLYVVCNFVYDNLFFPSALILWVTIYFTIAYMKLYLIDFVDNKKANVVVILIGMLGNYGMVVALNVIGLKVNSLNGKLSFLNTSCSPFILMMVIGMFNIARNMRLNNRLICCVSKLSMFMYIIHENVILRYYYRPMMWQYVYCNYGYDNILIWYLLMVLAVFCFAFVASVIYKNTIQKLVKKMADKLYMQVVMCAYGVESVLLKFK